MRDSIKSEKYFDEFIAEDTARILKLTKKVNDGEVRPERLVPVKQAYLPLPALVYKKSSNSMLVAFYIV